LANIDHRSAPMRRLKDLVQAHVADLGGSELVSEAELCLVRRAAMITLQLEMLDSKFAAANGSASECDLNLYGRLTGGLRRVLATLGLKRRSRVVEETLTQYLVRHADVDTELDAEDEP
jgi:hypothetical protein